MDVLTTDRQTETRRDPLLELGAHGSLLPLGPLDVQVLITIVMEWLATQVVGRWAYAEAMPVVPVLGVGLSPLLQWIVLGACPEVEILGDEVRIGEADNLAVLKKEEWNVLVDLIRSGQLTRI